MEPFYSNNKEEEEEEKHFNYAMQVVGSSALPMVLKAAIELQVLDIIAKKAPEPNSPPLKLRVGCHPLLPLSATRMHQKCSIGCCVS